MKHGFNVPNFGAYADIRALAAAAREAEDAGWDGFFIWDHMRYDRNLRAPIVDPWVALTAVALATQRIRFGTMITPVSRRRPWKLARETATLDVLSGGRLILGVGLGFPPHEEYAAFGEEPDDRIRAQKLDEGLDILAGLWSGEPFSYAGAHYRVEDTTFLPTPVQSPRIPIWVAAMLPAPAPLRRAARWDGVAPIRVTDTGIATLSVDEIGEMMRYMRSHRSNEEPFDVVIAGWADNTPEDAERLAGYAHAGVTWFIQSPNPYDDALTDLRDRVAAGPPPS